MFFYVLLDSSQDLIGVRQRIGTKARSWSDGTRRYLVEVCKLERESGMVDKIQGRDKLSFWSVFLGLTS